MKILVIDDTKRNLDSAIKTLTDHDVTICQTYDEAIVLLGNQWDAVLCDLMMPVVTSNKAAGPKRAFLNKEMVSGWSLALMAAMHGTKFVIVASRECHHRHPGSAMLDAFKVNYEYHIFSIDEAKVMFTNNIPMVELGGEEEANCYYCKGGDFYDYDCYCGGLGINPAIEDVREDLLKYYKDEVSKYGRRIGEQCNCVSECGHCHGTGKSINAIEGKDWSKLLNDLMDKSKEN